MFSQLMINTWIAATIVAVVAGSVGFFAVLRNSAFPAHTLPQSGFAGAACASLLGLNTLIGLGVFSFLGAATIGLLGRRGRNDAVTALTLVMLLGLGALFLSFSVEYAPEIYSLLFGTVLGVSRGDLLPLGLLGLAAVASVTVLYRPLLLSSVLRDVGEARGLNAHRLHLCLLGVLALATTVTVPVVGTFLMFSLMIGPAASARLITANPLRALALSIALALAIVWIAIAAAYETNWPIGFYVGTIAAASYTVVRALSTWRAHSRDNQTATIALQPSH